MRKFRYRIWYKDMMLYPPDSIDSMTTCRQSDGFQTGISPHLSLDGRWYINGECQKFELMQFTGLSDKNGKEIYAGDLYQVAKNAIYQVKYCEGGISDFEWYGGMFILYSTEELFFPFDDFSMKTGEVIGNIYENPELIK